MSVLERLDETQRLAAGAAVAMFLTMFLPWYEQRTTGVVEGQLRNESDNLAPFEVFSFIEAAVLLVAVGVIALLVLRARGATFELPGGDGTVVAAAGGWIALLLLIRLFDKPEGTDGAQITVTMGIQWGIFIAFLAAGALCAAGLRLRAADGEAPPPPQ
jgi:hypothetical protein